jgi:tRNA1(Val) A37 N6-methylase TrmN6
MTFINNFINRNSSKIFIISFLILFFELTLIRYISATIVSISFYSNIILLASFFGVGAGCLLNVKKNLFNYFPALIFILLLILNSSLLMINTSESEMLMFQDFVGEYKIPSWLIIIFIFSFVAFLFLILGQQLKLAFRNFEKSIDAYLFDLLGSIAGIIIFSTLSYFELGFIYWISITFILWLLINHTHKNPTKNKKHDSFFAWILAIAFALFLNIIHENSWWSKYYFIKLTEFKKGEYYHIFTNKTGHQVMEIKPKLWFYRIPYDSFKNPQYDDVLIIGVGSGQDASIALQNNVKNIDAVDIEPRLVELGKQYHPLKPYSDPRVKITIADGRNFIENQKDKKYDLIIFALTDSLTLASNSSNTRLESYLMTVESFAKAKSLLKENGMLMLYNNYRKDWLIEKLTKMLEQNFPDKVLVITSKIDESALLIAGNKITNFNEAKFIKEKTKLSFKKTSEIDPENQVGTDNWPFSYLFKPSIPSSYLTIISFIISLSGTAVFLFLKKYKAEAENKNLSWQKFLTIIPWHMFFLGAGFMLLETKNIINFQLLFGSTWIVNSLVFIAILGLALTSAILTKMKLIFNKKILYFLMIFAIAISIFFPLKSIIELPFYLKYLSAILISLLPIFFANLIFSNHFSHQNNAEISFGLNMVGALFGGLLEYLSMIYGYHFLLYLIGFCYLMAIIFVEFIYCKKS